MVSFDLDLCPRNDQFNIWSPPTNSRYLVNINKRESISLGTLTSHLHVYSSNSMSEVSSHICFTKSTCSRYQPNQFMQTHDILLSHKFHLNSFHVKFTRYLFCKNSLNFKFQTFRIWPYNNRIVSDYSVNHCAGIINIYSIPITSYSVPTQVLHLHKNSVDHMALFIEKVAINFTSVKFYFALIISNVLSV